MKIKFSLTIPIASTITLIILKLCDIISWSWLWIFSPIPIGIVLDIIIAMIIVNVFNRHNTYKSNKQTSYGRPLVWDMNSKELY